MMLREIVRSVCRWHECHFCRKMVFLSSTVVIVMKNVYVEEYLET
jgi:hypothetical protein